MTAQCGAHDIAATIRDVYHAKRQTCRMQGFGHDLRLNGAVVAISEPGGALYRDLPPGHYHITVDSDGVDSNQTRDVDLLPGQEAFAKIVSNDNWVEFGGFKRRIKP